MSFYYPLPEKEVKTKKNYDCEVCKIYKRKKISSPYFFPVIGDKYNGLVVLGSRPSPEDDEKGRPFIDDMSKTIRSVAYRNGVNLAQQGALMYALSCCPGSGKKGTEVQFKCCRSILVEHLNELKPKMIICCGEMAFKSLFDLKKKVPPSKLRGRVIPNYEFNCSVFTLLNPIDISKRQGHLQYALRKDMERAINLWKTKFSKRKKVDEDLTFKKILDGIEIIEVKNYKQLVKCFKWVAGLDESAFDYETTNTKPYNEYFEITHISFGNKKLAYVINESLWQKFPVWRKIKNFVKWYLENPSIHKIIQNDKFEELCSRYIMGIKTIKNSSCPMLATHIVDERRGCTSLDFQNLTRFGIPPYSDTVKTFLQKKEKDDKVNRIREAPYDDLIQYAGLDVITTYYNWKFLELILPQSYDKANQNYKFIHRGHKLFANMSYRGVKAGRKELQELEDTLISEIQDVLEGISALPEFIEYNNYLGKQLNTTKQGDQKLLKLQLKVKEESNETTNEKIGGKKINLKRKIQF